MAPRILLADTADAQLAALTTHLRCAGFALAYASSPQNLIEAFDAAPADVVILHLGTAGAQNACQALRGHALGATVPIVFVAGDGADIDAPSDALAHGADALWHLPIDVETALGRIRSWVGPSAPHALAVAATEVVAKPPPPAAAARVPRLTRLFGWAPKAAPQPKQMPPRVAMAPPPALRRLSPPAWPPRGMGGGAAMTAAQPALCAPWSDPDAAAREHIRATCARMQVADYYALVGLPSCAPYLVVCRALQALQTQFAPSQFSAELRRDARLELDLIAQMLQEAHFVLADAERARAYRRHMRPSAAPKP